jgi:hypothetical protein
VQELASFVIASLAIWPAHGPGTQAQQEHARAQEDLAFLGPVPLVAWKRHIPRGERGGEQTKRHSVQWHVLK